MFLTRKKNYDRLRTYYSSKTKIHMAKLNLNALSKAQSSETADTKVSVQTPEILWETEKKSVEKTPSFPEKTPEKKLKITLKNGKVNSVHHHSMQEKAPVIKEVEKISSEESVCVPKEKNMPEAALMSENWEKKPEILPKISKFSQQEDPTHNVSIQDWDTNVSMVHHQKTEFFTNFSGSYAPVVEKETEKKPAETALEKIKKLSPIKTHDSTQNTPINTLITPGEEIVSEEVVELAETQEIVSQAPSIPEKKPSLLKTRRTALVASLGVFILSGIWAGGVFYSHNTPAIQGNIQEVSNLQEPLTQTSETITPENKINNETQNTNVNSNNIPAIDNTGKNDKINEEIKEYLLKKYKHN